MIQLARGNGTLRHFLDRIHSAGGEVRVPAVLVTGDPADMHQLLDGQPGVMVRTLGDD